MKDVPAAAAAGIAMRGAIDARRYADILRRR
jgi:hypothetical protein